MIAETSTKMFKINWLLFNDSGGPLFADLTDPAVTVPAPAVRQALSYGTPRRRSLQQASVPLGRSFGTSCRGRLKSAAAAPIVHGRTVESGARSDGSSGISDAKRAYARVGALRIPQGTVRGTDERRSAPAIVSGCCAAGAAGARGSPRHSGPGSTGDRNRRGARRANPATRELGVPESVGQADYRAAAGRETAGPSVGALHGRVVRPAADERGRRRRSVAPAAARTVAQGNTGRIHRVRARARDPGRQSR